MTLGALLYFVLLALWSAGVAYAVCFKLWPALTAPPAPPKAPAHAHAPAKKEEAKAAASRYSNREGFKSFKTGNDLTVDDIVKGLSR